MPILAYPLGLEHFQDIWMWFYIPFAVLYGVFIWYQPDEDMMKWIFITPGLFLLVSLTILPLMVGVNAGIVAAFQYLMLIAIVAVPAAFIMGLIYVAIAIVLFALFRKKRWLPSGN